MDTRYLESFVAVVDTGSLAAASRHLGITAAALALRIKTLEAEFSVKLIARSGRHVRATSAGTAVYERSIPFLIEAKELKSIGLGGRIAGELRLGAISTALTGVLPAILQLASTDFPDLDIHVSPGTSVDLYRKIETYEIDAALLVHPPFPLNKELVWVSLRSEGLVLLLPEWETSNDPSEILSRSPFIRYDRRHWGGRLADNFLRDHSIKVKELFELDALEAIAVLVGIGLGVSLVPNWSGPWPEGVAVRKLPIHDPSYVRQIGLLWIRGSRKEHLIEAVLNHRLDKKEMPTAPIAQGARPIVTPDIMRR